MVLKCMTEQMETQYCLKAFFKYIIVTFVLFHNFSQFTIIAKNVENTKQKSVSDLKLLKNSVTRVYQIYKFNNCLHYFYIFMKVGTLLLQPQKIRSDQNQLNIKNPEHVMLLTFISIDRFELSDNKSVWSIYEIIIQ